MPKKPVIDPITDQEIAFAHLVMSGTMNDRQAAKAAGLNQDSAAYIKSKPRVRAYMDEYRDAVKQKLLDQEAEGLRSLTVGRDQILTRLWYLAGVSPEVTKGSITQQIKAISMIIAIEGLMPGRGHSVARPQPLKPPAHIPEPARRRQDDFAAPDVAAAAEKAPPAAPRVPAPGPLSHPACRHESLDNPFLYPKEISPFFDTMGRACDVNLNPPAHLTLSIPAGIGGFPRSR